LWFWWELASCVTGWKFLLRLFWQVNWTTAGVDTEWTPRQLRFVKIKLCAPGIKVAAERLVLQSSAAKSL